jgi:hypothetical protein
VVAFLLIRIRFVSRRLNLCREVSFFFQIQLN